MQTNRRQYQRFQVAVTAELDVAGETRVGETRDISLGGASVLVNCQLEEKQTIDLALILTQDGIEDPNEDPFETKANIMWSAPSDGGQFMIGLRFVELSPNKSEQLKRFIDAMADS
jgi:c-di-GMP-binding flagellar brake protein YcgR